MTMKKSHYECDSDLPNGECRECYNEDLNNPQLKVEYALGDIMGKVIEGPSDNILSTRYPGGLSSDYMENLAFVANNDVEQLNVKNREYGGSWKKRGGTGAFMMLARKWDRLELQAAERGYDIFQTLKDDTRSEGVLDDIRDLRRYLMLVEAEMLSWETGV